VHQTAAPVHARNTRYDFSGDALATAGLHWMRQSTAGVRLATAETDSIEGFR
jgi:hypothetical protein